MTMSGQARSKTEQPFSPGRLADPNRVLKTDPRADPRMVAALAEFGFDEAPPPAPVTAESPLDEILEFIAVAEPGYEDLFTAWLADLPPIESLERRTEVIKGVDDNDISLFIHKPQNASGPLPCVYHIHGGAMVLLEAAGSLATRAGATSFPLSEWWWWAWSFGTAQGSSATTRSLQDSTIA